MKFVRTLLFLVLINNVFNEETHCSKYDFLEKVLEKLVRMEFNENQKLVEFERIKTDVSNNLEKTETFSTNIKNVIDLTVAEIDRHVTESVAKVDETVSLVADNTSKVTNDMEKKFAKLEKQIIDKLHKIQETTQTVAFKARLNEDVYPSSGQTLVYPVVMMNIGNGYDSSTGVFTSPVIGTYIFDIVICPSNDKNVNVAIVVDNEQITVVSFYGNEGHTCFSANAVVILKSEQRVNIKVNYASSGARIDHHSYRWNTFSGVLI